MSASYIQMHSIINAFTLEANTMNPDQTAPKGEDPNTTKSRPLSAGWRADDGPSLNAGSLVAL